MKKIIINNDRIKNKDIKDILKLCPFGGLQERDGNIELNSGCRMCGICVKKGPEGVFEYQEINIRNPEKNIKKSEWNGIAVYLDQIEGCIHPVSYELIGKAKELASKINHPVYALCIGSGITDEAKKVLKYGIDKLYIYDQAGLQHFVIEPYTAAFEDFINKVKPSVCLVGGTTTGRSLAPRTAARFHTGLTADCTFLDIKNNTDLDQIRPAFGGNIMAHIHTPEHRPQFATVRYKIFSAPAEVSIPDGEVHICSLDKNQLSSRIKVIEVKPKPPEKGIEEAEVIIVAGRGIKKQSDLRMLEELAECLSGQIAATRAIIEEGWVDPRRQIGLSGRTVKPKLIITCGVSGAIQFIAGMSASENIIAINTDKTAPIMNTAHTAIEGDLYEIIPELLKKYNAGKKIAAALR